ncbi:MAG: PIN domain-containing protein [Alphaproteobacteria bacterium]|nr:PIN domain-containing protein [Alphaproteobacteria bacterium]
MMTADTNVFVYTFGAESEPKTLAARRVVEFLQDMQAPIGLQVVGELQNALRRKLKHPAPLAALNVRQVLTAFDTFAPSRANAEEAIDFMSIARFSYWDGLLVTAARDAGCTVFFSEDMHDGARLGDLEIVNPFGAGGLSDRARVLLNI